MSKDNAGRALTRLAIKAHFLENLRHPEAQATTCHCGKTALYRVGKVGYCKAHKAEAASKTLAQVKEYDEYQAEQADIRKRWDTQAIKRGGRGPMRSKD